VKEVPSHFFVALLGQQEVDGLAVFVHSTIETNPLAPHFDISVVHPPTDPHGALAPVEFLFELWTVLDHSPVNGRVIHVDFAFFHEFYDMAGAQRVRQVPADSHENDLGWKIAVIRKYCISTS